MTFVRALRSEAIEVRKYVRAFWTARSLSLDICEMSSAPATVAEGARSTLDPSSAGSLRVTYLYFLLSSSTASR